jgi:chorismate dehydratase
MNIRVAYIPYLKMAPVHQGFGPEPLEFEGRRVEFRNFSPHTLGLEADKGILDAGAMSLVDYLNLSNRFEPLGNLGIGVKRHAQSVLLFSKTPLASLEGVISVTDETATSFRLLQVLLEKRYNLSEIQYGRIASSMLYDGSSNAVLLIGDEALRARQEGIKGLPIVTDLGVEWYDWQNLPFVFALWVVRQGLRQDSKDFVEVHLEKSLNTTSIDESIAEKEALKRGLTKEEVMNYWKGFAYHLTPAHLESIRRFQDLISLSHV